METLLVAIALWAPAQELAPPPQPADAAEADRSIPVPPDEAPPQAPPATPFPTPPAPVPASPRPTPPPDALMVLPVETGSLGPAVSTMLTHALTLQAGEAFKKVLGQQEVEELLRHETVRMLAGCSDESCVAELAQASGTRFVMVCRVQVLDGRHFWNCSLLDQAVGQVVRRRAMRASSLRELHAQARPMVRALAGLPEEARLTAAVIRRDVGIAGRKDAHALAAFARDHRDMTTQEAVTAFIVQRNRESRVLAWSEAAAFVVASLLLVPLPAMMLAAVVTNGVSQVLVLGWAGGACGVALLSLAALATGVALAGVDALDAGHVNVPQDGCCRDDAEILDEDGDVRSLQGAALLTALAGPMALAVSAGTCFVGAQIAPLLRLPTTSADAPFVVGAASSVAFLCGGLAACMACAVVPPTSLVTGMLLLFRPQAPLVGPARKRPTAEKRP